MLSGSDDAERMVADADEALGALEAFELTDQVAQAMITRGTVLGAALGRLHQGKALIKGGIEISDEAGYAFTSIRGRVNLSYVASVEEPLVGFEATKEAYEIARRTGQRGMALFQNHQVAAWHNFRGELDESDAVTSDPILEGAPANNRGSSVIQRGRAADLRGDSAGAAASYADAEALLEDSEDVQVVEALHEFAASRHLMEGRFDEAYAASIASAKQSTRPVAYTTTNALLAAFLTGNRDWLAELNQLYRDAGVTARFQAAYTADLIALIDDPTPGNLRAVEAHIAEYDEWQGALLVTFLVAGLARYGPESERERFDTDFRSRADKYGYQGILRLYEETPDN